MSPPYKERRSPPADALPQRPRDTGAPAPWARRTAPLHNRGRKSDSSGLEASGSPGRVRTCDTLINSQLRYHCATGEDGSPGRVRTCDTLINSQLRYHCATGECLSAVETITDILSHASRESRIFLRQRVYTNAFGGARVRFTAPPHSPDDPCADTVIEKTDRENRRSIWVVQYGCKKSRPACKTPTRPPRREGPLPWLGAALLA